MMVSVVAAAVYGYWSAATSTPSARAASRTPTASAARPHMLCDPHLRCETWSRPPSPAARTAASASSSASNSPSASLRMCDRVQRAVPRRGPDQGGHLDRPRVHARGVDEARREPDRARLDRRVDLGAPSPRSSIGGRRPGVGPEHRPADRPVPDEERDVRPERLALDLVEVLGERLPARGQRVRPQGQRDQLAPDRRDRRQRVAAVPRELGREPLAEVADERAVHEERAIGVAVRIDEARRDDPAATSSSSPTSPPPTTPRSPTARIRSPRTPTSASRPGAPVPSMTVPPRRSRSNPVTRAMVPRLPARPDAIPRTVASDGPLVDSAFRGAIAQLEERLHGMQKVRGSSPRGSTNERPPIHTPRLRRGVTRIPPRPP